MSRSVVETVLGAFVLVGALIFLVFSYSEGDAGEVSGYELSANFSNIGGLKVGDEVQISGVKVGQVASIKLDPTQYLAKVTMEIGDDVELPDDTVALISSQSLLGGKYMSLEPGASDQMLKNGGEIMFTQAPQNLEELLGKFIFSVQNSNKEDAAASPAPAAAVPQPPLQQNDVQEETKPQIEPQIKPMSYNTDMTSEDTPSIEEADYGAQDEPQTTGEAE